MSSYLIGEIAYNPRITVLPCSEVRRRWGRRAPGVDPGARHQHRRREHPRAAAGCSCCSGPSRTATGCPPSLARDERGFVLTGRDIPTRWWVDGLPPANLETTVPGVFAAGDIRAGSMKRVAVGQRRGRLRRATGAQLARPDQLSRPRPRTRGGGVADRGVYW